MKKQDRLVFAVFLILSLIAAQVSAGDEGGPMARAPLPLPLPAAPKQIGSAQGGTQSQTPQRELTRSHPSVEPSMSAVHLNKRTHRPRRLDPASLAARREEEHGRHSLGDVERAEAHLDRQVASTLVPPFPPPLPPFGYNPSIPPAYGYGVGLPASLAPRPGSASMRRKQRCRRRRLRSVASPASTGQMPSPRDA